MALCGLGGMGIRMQGTRDIPSVDNLRRALLALNSARVPEPSSMILSWEQGQRLNISREDFNSLPDAGTGLKLLVFSRP